MYIIIFSLSLSFQYECFWANLASKKCIPNGCVSQLKNTECMENNCVSGYGVYNSDKICRQCEVGID